MRTQCSAPQPWARKVGLAIHRHGVSSAMLLVGCQALRYAGICMLKHHYSRRGSYASQVMLLTQLVYEYFITPCPCCETQQGSACKSRTLYSCKKLFWSGHHLSAPVFRKHLICGNLDVIAEQKLETCVHITGLLSRSLSQCTKGSCR